jgi:hypothetical protein
MSSEPDTQCGGASVLKISRLTASTASGYVNAGADFVDRHFRKDATLAEVILERADERVWREPRAAVSLLRAAVSMSPRRRTVAALTCRCATRRR